MANKPLHRRLWIVLLSLLFGIFTGFGLVVQRVQADSPPNLTTNIPWTDTGGAGPAVRFGGVEDVEAAFNHGRRQEEVQLGLAVSALGTLDLPAQAHWDALNDEQRLLYLLNVERLARAGMKPGILGLPFAGIESNLDQTAQTYAELLVATNTFGHYQPSGNPAIDNPQVRINQTPVVKDCIEDLARAENIFALWVSRGSVPLAIERAVYGWIYNDAGSAWGHRQAALLQDKDVNGNATGFKNNAGSALHEGLLGLGHAEKPGYNPTGGTSADGEAVVLKLIDPAITVDCPTDAGLSDLAVTAHSATDQVATGQLFSVTVTVTNTGATVLTNVALTTTIAISHLQWLSASLAPTNQNEATGQGVWQGLEGQLPNLMLQPGEVVQLVLYLRALAPVNTRQTLLRATSAATGGWGGETPDKSAAFQAQITAPLLNEVAYDQSGSLHEEFVELYNPSAAPISLNGYALLLVDGTTGGVYVEIPLPNVTLAGGDYFVICGDNAHVANCDLAALDVNNPIQNGSPDAVALSYVHDGGAILVDALSYAGDAPLPYREGTGAGLQDAPINVLSALARLPNGVDTNQNSADWSPRCSSSGAANRTETTNCTPDLVITQSASPTTVAPGQPVIFTLHYSNDGFSCAPQMSLNAPLPAFFSSMEAKWQGSPIQLIANSNLAWSEAALCPGESGVITVTAVVKTPLAAGTQFGYTAAISTAFPEQTLANNQAPTQVTVANVAPKASADAASTVEEQPVTVNVLTNDSDANGEILAISAVGAPAHGSATISGATIRYTPTLNFAGVDEFTYTARDAGGNISVSKAVITVTPVNDAPIFTSAPLTATSVGAAYRYPLVASDVDTGDQLTFTLIEGPSWLALAGSLLQGEPPSGAEGDHTVRVRVTDLAGASAEQSFVLTVEASAANDFDWLYLPVVTRR